MNCQCTNQDFLSTATYNFTTDRCLVYNASVSDCCLTKDEQDLQIPQLSCPNTVDFQPTTGCKCQGSIVNGKFDRVCDCNINYQGKTYTIQGLNTSKDSCMCNTTTCGCCIAGTIIIATTERQCAVNELRSTCQQCTTFFNNRTNTTQQNCTQCQTFVDAMTVYLNQNYTNIAQDSCLCRDNMTNNCTCCLTQKPAGPVAPQCPANFSELLPNCACTTTNGTQTCNCSRVVSGVESYFNNIVGQNCSCINLIKNGKEATQCQCCASTAQITLAQPVCSAFEQSVEQCSCTAGFNCDCRFKSTGVTLRGLQNNATVCSCPNNNATSKSCDCCVPFQAYRDAMTPSCQNSDVVGHCACVNITTVVRRVTKVTQRCNCTAELKSEKGTTFYNDQSLIVSPSSCNVYNETTGQTVYKCCVRESELSQPPLRACKVADSLNGTCTFWGPNNTTRQGDCYAKSNGTTYFFDALTVNSSDCSC